MNLSLLDPFRRQLPDRIDCTLSLPKDLQYLDSSAFLNKAETRERNVQSSSTSYNRLMQVEDGGDSSQKSGMGNDGQNPSSNANDECGSSSSQRGPSPFDERGPSIDTISSKKRKHDESGKNSDGRKAQMQSEEMMQCMHVSYNRRGTYLSVGFANGTVAIWDTTSRTLAALFYPVAPHPVGSTSFKNMHLHPIPLVTCSSWTRRGRILWISRKFSPILERVNVSRGDPDLLSPLRADGTQVGAAASSAHKRPLRSGFIEYLPLIHVQSKSGSASSPQDAEKQNETIPSNAGNVKVYGKHGRILNGANATPEKIFKEDEDAANEVNEVCQTQVIELPHPLNSKTGAVAHPFDDQISFAVLSDGSLVLIYFPSFVPSKDAPGNRENKRAAKIFYMVRSGGHRSPNTFDNKRTHVNCVTINPANGKYAYAICANGLLLCFKLWAPKKLKHPELPPYRSKLLLQVPTTNFLQNVSDDNEARIPRKVDASNECTEIPVQRYEIVASRHGDMLVVNFFPSGQLKLYDTKIFEEKMVQAAESRASDSEAKAKGNKSHEALILQVKPRFVFTDPVDGSRMAFVSCDFSGDGEYLVGACNSFPQPGDKYELYVWNTSTGTLHDRLTGPQTILNSVCYHPVKASISAATFDGIVDVWGPRLDWAAFAPDFQALPCNMEYVEREDEFDTIVSPNGKVSSSDSISPSDDVCAETEGNQEEVDVVGVEKIPVFDSDSENEEDVFYFQARLKRETSLRSRATKPKVK